MNRLFTILLMLLVIFSADRISRSQEPPEPFSIWPEFAPGETTRSRGRALPFRPEEKPPVTRMIEITDPTLTVYQSSKPNGVSVLVLPGGGFVKVVPDKEGSELATQLAKSGITTFVLNYRTKGKDDAEGWKKPLQDAQRAMALIRSQAKSRELDPNKIGLVGFSAGGQVATRLLCGPDQKAYPVIDDQDGVSHRPNFTMLIYPWRIYDEKKNRLIDGMEIGKKFPPAFLVHTDDDRATSLGVAEIYMQLKREKIPAELHIYGNGGHGYGLRNVKGSQISTWIVHARHWLVDRKLGGPIADQDRD